MKIAASLTFDPSYVECALLTAYELIKRTNRLRRIYLLLLSSEGPDDKLAQELVAEFCERFSSPDRLVSAIVVKNTLNSFSAYHFNNSIIYKALIPSILPGEPFILNIDAGFLVGQRFDEFIDSVVESHNGAGIDWVVSAHCLEPEANLPPALAAHPHHHFYPAGGLFYFNTRNYFRADWFDRYVANYSRFFKQLCYAEQELVCLTATEGELRTLPSKEDIRLRQLGTSVLEGQNKRLSPVELEDCALFKFTGSLKPWKYWVLDPNKSLYLTRRALMDAEFTLSGVALIERHRELALRPDWVRMFQQSYERSLIRPSA